MSTTYIFRDAETDNDVMLRALAGMYDPFSERRLREAGIAEDARCLVVAVGASGIARTIAGLAPRGEVIATDVDLRPCQRDPRVDLREHDVVTDPLPGMFDLIHVRLLLGHLPQRLDVLGKLVDALNPDGVLVVEEFEATWRTSVLAAPDPDEADRLFGAYHDAFQAALQDAGNRSKWSRRVHGAMLDLGLTECDTVGYTGTWAGGSHGCLLPWGTAGAIRQKLIDAGMSGADLDAFRQLLLVPELRVKGNLALSTVGRRRR
ncbi:trans-aconitate 2-methyltransferase [Plantactinospora sp. BB1]|uniref:class I SAM-dependent methyltransferase n=1 Tax=Plantactinospora sp. BB1 TaxID=2071627 RepID=UPI000D162C6A|nr:class I SAM-dependent methyltransferase [Plantactinospora sp. BB1]AVT40090.1 methyltransferase [Plantactinospora sp. BB1]